jgi:predicted kinase
MKVTIMRGVSGAGKSTYVRKNFPISNGAIVCSADKHFQTADGYVFDSTQLPAAHQSCLRQYMTAIHNYLAGYSQELTNIVVDNTNTQLWELSPYLSIAQAYGLEVEIVHCVCPPDVATERNIHGVPAKSIEAMAKRFEKLLPWWPKEIVVNTGE